MVSHSIQWVSELVCDLDLDLDLFFQNIDLYIHIINELSVEHIQKRPSRKKVLGKVAMERVTSLWADLQRRTDQPVPNKKIFFHEQANDQRTDRQSDNSYGQPVSIWDEGGLPALLHIHIMHNIIITFAHDEPIGPFRGYLQQASTLSRCPTGWTSTQASSTTTSWSTRPGAARHST